MHKSENVYALYAGRAEGLFRVWCPIPHTHTHTQQFSNLGLYVG